MILNSNMITNESSFYFNFLLSECIAIVLQTFIDKVFFTFTFRVVIFVDIVNVPFVDVLSVTFTISAHTITES